MTSSPTFLTVTVCLHMSGLMMCDCFSFSTSFSQRTMMGFSPWALQLISIFSPFVASVLLGYDVIMAGTETQRKWEGIRSSLYFLAVAYLSMKYGTVTGSLMLEFISSVSKIADLWLRVYLAVDALSFIHRYTWEHTLDILTQTQYFLLPLKPPFNSGILANAPLRV